MARSLLCSKAHPDLLRIGGPGHPTKIPKKLVDTIADSDASSIIIEGLDQKNFEHFVSTYGVQFTEIQLSRCRTIADFSPLEKLPQIKYLAIRHNIRASALWNIRANPKLTHLELSGLNKIRGIDALAEGRALQELEFTGSMYNGPTINSLKPIAALTQLEQLSIWGIAFEEQPSMSPLLPLTKLQFLQLAEGYFSFRQIAWFNARFRGAPSYRPFEPYTVHEEHGLAFVTGKDGPTLKLPRDQRRLEEYGKRFEDLVAYYKEKPDEPEPIGHESGGILT